MRHWSPTLPIPHSVPPDLALALSTAGRLMEFGRCEYSEVSASVELPTVAEVRWVAGGGRAARRVVPGQEKYGEFDGVPFEE
ncbi:hypothetical protein ACODT5_16440 [Streptomyces sp. 5.8]|uniref:hypothetical protein n=1 Tax=Streptomyces sp. 5.8 TaxID=3406571 RepID=UPI003BB5178C